MQADELAPPSRRHTRAHGTGTLFWHTPRRRWVAKASVADGRRTKCFSSLQYGSRGAARREAEAWLQTMAVDNRRGDLVLLRGSTPLLADAITEYLAKFAGTTPETLVHLERRLRKLEDPKDPQRRIADVDDTLLGPFFTAIAAQYSPKEYAHTRAAVRGMLEHYRHKRKIPGSQVDWALIKDPVVQPRNYQLFQVVGSPDATGERDERMRFLAAARAGSADCSCHPSGAYLEALFALQANEALSPGEALGLAWADLPSDLSTVSINRTNHKVSRILAKIEARVGRRDLTQLAKEFTSGRTGAKRSARIRTLPLSEGSRGALQAWRDQAPVDAVLVFPAADGGPERLQHVDALCKRLCVVAGLPHHVPTDFRHTAITIALAYTRQADGVSIADVSHWAGHAQSSTTLDNYTHVLPQAPGLIAALARHHRADLKSSQTWPLGRTASPRRAVV
jgi:integrase